MQENALHGWKLADGKHMRMTGYPAKVKSLSWSAKGKWLASSGAPAAIVWPFPGQGRADGQGAAGARHARQHHGDRASPAIRPRTSWRSATDGMVLAARFADPKEVLLRRPGKGAITGS